MGHLQRSPTTGHLLRKVSSPKHLANDCGDVCFTKFTTTFDCNTSTWSAWANAGNFCLIPTTSTARTHTGGGGYQQYVRKSPDVPCTVDGDCAGHDATAPALPTDTPHDATGVGCTSCGCSHAVSFHATVGIAGTTSCTACFVAADNTGSAIVSAGVADGTYTLDRVGTCRWQIQVAGPALDQDCFDIDCSGNNGPIAHNTQMVVALFQTGVNTWRITATSFPGASTFYDSGNFAWNDQDACDGVPSAAQANTSPGCVLPTGCAPTWCGHGGTGTASF